MRSVKILGDRVTIDALPLYLRWKLRRWLYRALWRASIAVLRFTILHHHPLDVARRDVLFLSTATDIAEVGWRVGREVASN